MTQVRGDSALQTEVLEDLAEAVNYRQWLCALAAPWLGDDPLEIGSGVGYYAQDLLDDVPRITVSEADPSRLAELHKRFDDDERVTVRELLVPITVTGEHSSVVAFNVLEHIPDDVEALRTFAGLVRPGGRIVMLCPAFPLGMSRFDREVGHVRRYTKATIAAAGRDAGLQVEQVHYVGSVGLLAWIVNMRLLGGRPQAGRALRLWDRYVIPAVRWVEARVRPPFGQSVLLVATVPAS